MSEPKKGNCQVTDYAAILNLHEEADVIHISGDTRRKMQNAEREHHINAVLIDNGEVRRRMSMIPAKFESKFPEFLRKESVSEKKVCLGTLRGNGACKIDQYEAVPLASTPRMVHVTIDPEVQAVSTKQSISRLVQLCLNRLISIYIIPIHIPNCTHLFVFFDSATPGSPHLRKRIQLTLQGTQKDARMILLRTKEARITRIALGIVSLYILCHIWRLVPNIYDLIYGSDEQYPRWLEHLVGFSHIMVVFNSAINFLLYLVL